MESSMEIPQQTRDRIAIISSDTALGIYSNDPKTGYSRDTSSLMFIATLFTITKLWIQPRGPTPDDWIKKFWYIYTQGSITQSQGIMMCGLKVNGCNFRK
jgi:hypothetical protein